jgi:hypothetical protein
MSAKRFTAATAAKQVIAAGQPLVEFNAAANVKQPEPPAKKKPLPAPLAKALGQSGT